MPPPEKKPAGQWLDSWHVDPSANREYDFIDGLRGIAILMVLCGHHIYVNPKSGATVQFFGNLFGAGGSGIVLFFTLSGFLISWPFWKWKFTGGKHTVPPGYARRRFFKIYPPLALSVVVFTPFYILLTHDNSYIPIAAKWLAGIPFFLPVSGKLNPVMWTLVIEAQFYMVLPLVFLLLKKVPPKVCLWIIPSIFLVIPMAYRISTGLWYTVHPDINTHFPSPLDAFCLGIWLAGLDNQGGLAKKWALLGAAGLVLWPLALLLHACTETFPAMHGWSLEYEIGIERIASFCLLCYIADPKHRVARLLCSPWLRWCGIISYEWYLFHQPIILWARETFGPAEGNLARYAAIVGGSFLFSGILSAFIYRYFSLPILKYGRARKQNP